ncbi:hypothetical protein PN36_15250 [Candidatus Thiomargarita nelsonii]|uniref:Uncharacterized protein n=1 Tax=Candidatus Thiomargarita nelsonii TaxID=1003181 RepID=A0A4E0QV99_9GAMM|nr:hypothetical protein PN36_15250 [Candidatus Thiomargarita nelsonii]
MKVSFSELDLKQLTKISQWITNGKWVEELIDICQGISLSVPNQEFPLIYAGVLLARNNQVDNAIKVLRLCQSSVFGKTLAEYLSETHSFSKRVKTFKEAKPYDAWMQTEIYQSIRAGVLEMVKHFAKQNPPHSLDEPTIIDIGPGNGILTVEIVKQLQQVYPLRGLHLILIEPSEEMMALAIQHCQASIPMPVQITPLCNCTLQSLTSKDQKIIQEHQPIWFINASLSLHHIPRELKVPNMEILNSISTSLLMTEIDENLEELEDGSPELIHTVNEIYSNAIQEVLNINSASVLDKKSCIDSFFLADAITVLKNIQELRVEHWISNSQWQDVAKYAGFKVVKTTPIVSSIPFFTLELKNQPTSDGLN